MPTVLILYDVEGWAFHRRAAALQKYTPSDFQVSTAAYNHHGELEAALGETAPDILILQRQTSTHEVKTALHRRGWRTRLVVIWNCGWPRRVAHLARVHEVADLVIFNNREYWDNSGRLPGTRMIPNGVDLEIFNVTTPLDTRRPKVLWAGSEINRRLKGYDDYLLPLHDRLSERGIEADFRLVDSFGRDKLGPQEMAQWYNGGTVLVCASQTEGTPNTALEAAACGCTIVSTRVGNMPELIRDGENGYLVERSVSALLRGVRAACKNHPALAGQLLQDIRKWDWAESAAEIYEALRELPAPSSRRVAVEQEDERPDLSDDVTVFVATVGAASFDACIACLKLQDCRFRLEVIDRVAPMSAAFQRMLDDCTTPYYVQVDEDMLLYPHAIRTLYEAMQQEGPRVAIYVAALHDAHLGEHIQGVKIFRHEIVRDYPFAERQGCEVEQIRRLKKDGYEYAIRPRDVDKDPFTETLGLHGTHWTPDLIYLRYSILEQRRRRRLSAGERIPGLPVTLAERFCQDPSELNFFALLGAMAGSLCPIEGRGREKDYRDYGDDPAYRLAARLFRELTAKSPSEPES